MTFLDFVLKYWELIGFIAVVTFYCLASYFKIDDHEKRIGKLEDEKDTTTGAISDINIRLGTMDGKLDILVEGYKKERAS